MRGFELAPWSSSAGWQRNWGRSTLVRELRPEEIATLDGTIREPVSILVVSCSLRGDSQPHAAVDRVQ
jgi:hypothetical protein